MHFTWNCLLGPHWVLPVCTPPRSSIPWVSDVLPLMPSVFNSSRNPLSMAVAPVPPTTLEPPHSRPFMLTSYFNTRELLGIRIAQAMSVTLGDPLSLCQQLPNCSRPWQELKTQFLGHHTANKDTSRVLHSELWAGANLVICEIGKQTDAIKMSAFGLLQLLECTYKT